LDVIVESPTSPSLTELVTASGLTKPTVRRLLLGLAAQGFVRQDQFRRYTAGARLLDVAATALERYDFPNESQDALQSLQDAVAGTVALAEYTDRQLSVAATLTPATPYKVAARRIGSVGLHASAAGKTILAFLPRADVHWLLGSAPLTRYTANTLTTVDDVLSELREIAGRGYAINNEESQLGVRCVSAVVRNHLALPVAAVSVAMASSQSSLGHARREAVKVVAAADTITRRIGGPELLGANGPAEQSR